MTTQYLEQARARFARVAFAARLGITIAELAHDRAVLVLPYASDHMNAGGVLNGGASASLVTIAGTLAAWAGVDVDAKTDLRCVDLSVQYLDAGRDDDVIAEARVLRRGRDLVFLDVGLRSRADVPICRGLLTYQTADHAGHAPRLRADHILLPAPSALTPPGPRVSRRLCGDSRGGAFSKVRGGSSFSCRAHPNAWGGERAFSRGRSRSSWTSRPSLPRGRWSRGARARAARPSPSR